MSLNIKNPETCRLAEELAELTSENKTQAITIALRERLERLRRNREEEVQAMMEIGRRASANMGPGPSSTEIGDFLYDERGVPK